MTLSIEEWTMGDAYRLHTLWKEATSGAPTCYAVDAETFCAGILPDEEDDETCATSQSQRLIVATQASEPVGFAHLGAGSVEVNGEALDSGIIRFLAFAPGSSIAGQALLDHAEHIFRDEGQPRIDAFPIYHGYPFHNHKVGILSDCLVPLCSLLVENGYHPHDSHLTLERSLESTPLPEPRPDVDIVVEKTIGPGSRPDIRVWARIEGEAKGNCRTVSGLRYARHDSLDSCGYTRWLGVSESYRQRGIGRVLLKRALHEMRLEGYTTTRLNVREKNLPALALYASEGYTTEDHSSAYFKDLGA
jgi:ribosomal protein S18 acetylase RimI-like enzyme